MSTNTASRRTALKWVMAGSVTTLASACGSLPNLPRGNTGSTTDGKELSMAVRRALLNHPTTSQLALTISSEEDLVFLKGLVPYESDLRNAETVANQVSGVRHVQMDVYVKN